MPNTSEPSSAGTGGMSSASGVGEQARQFADEVKQGAQTFAEDGKAKGADRLKGVADTANRVAIEVANESPMMADWVRKAADELDSASRNLKDKSIADLLTIGKDFARREPAAFIAASAFAGFALSRLLKSTSAARTPQFDETAGPASSGATAQDERTSGSETAILGKSTASSSDAKPMQCPATPGSQVDAQPGGGSSFEPEPISVQPAGQGARPL